MDQWESAVYLPGKRIFLTGQLWFLTPLFWVVCRFWWHLIICQWMLIKGTCVCPSRLNLSTFPGWYSVVILNIDSSVASVLLTMRLASRCRLELWCIANKIHTVEWACLCRCGVVRAHLLFLALGERFTSNIWCQFLLLDVNMPEANVNENSPEVFLLVFSY